MNQVNPIPVKSESNSEDLCLLISYLDETLKGIYSALLKIKNEPPHRMQESIFKLISNVRFKLNSYPDAEQIIKQADVIRKSFFLRLKKEFPSLTKGELELCVSLRLGLSNKEIADLRKVQESSVKKARQRLRKKLGLGVSENIHLFLNSL